MAGKKTTPTTKSTKAAKPSIKSAAKKTAKTSKVVTQKTSTPKISVPKFAVTNPIKKIDLSQARELILKYKFYIIAVLVLAIGVMLFNRFGIVAWVDNKPVTRMEFYKDLETRYGKDTLDQLIVEKLIREEAATKGINVTEEEINAEITKYETEQGGKEALAQILVSQNISESEFKDLVEFQLLRQKLFENGVTVTDEEVDQYIEQNKDALVDPENPQTASQEAQLKSEIRDQLIQQKVAQNYSNWAMQNLNSDRVRRN